MKPLHKIFMVSATFVLAAATGHVMQNPVSFGLAHMPPAQPEPPVALELTNVQAVANVPAAEPIVLSGNENRAAPQLPEPPPLRSPAATAMPATLPAETDTAGFSAVAEPEPACALPEIGVRQAPSASVVLNVSSPCLPNQVALVHHEGLTLPVQLSATGEWSGIVPALAEDAYFEVDLSDGTILSATQPVTGLADVNRLVLSWEGKQAFFLHALEYGSAYGGAGDVSALSPRSPETALGGWMARYGYEAQAPAGASVQIYTAPAGMGDIRLELEAVVSAELCGQDVDAEMRRLIAGKAEAPVALRLAMPACDAPEGLEGGIVMPLPDFPLAVALAN